MDKRNDRTKRSNRKKGLKNPIVLWLCSLAVTLILTVLPTALLAYLPAGDRSDLLRLDTWIQIVMGNLFPMMVTQSVVTMLQNYAISLPSQTEREADRPAINYSLTVWLSVVLLIYTLAYPILVLADPPRLNVILFLISGFLAGFGAGSTSQIDKEQERIQAARIAKIHQEAERVLAESGPPNARSVLENVEGDIRSESGTLV